MKKTHCFGLALVMLSFHLLAQDEGSIVKKERVTLSKSIYFGGGPSFTLGKNIGDYSTGLNFEAGFMTRPNRVFSIGPSFSYISFKYDPEETGFNNIFIGGPYQDMYGYYFYEGLYFNLSGGDLSLISAACNLKLNLIPISDNTKVSIYAFAKPFVTYAMRTEVKGTGVYMVNYGDVYDVQDWENYDEFVWEAGEENYGYTTSDNLKEQSKVTGGIFIGPGIEFMPANKLSFYFQVAIGYTFPVSYISTQAYKNDEGELGNDLDVFLEDIEEYPMHEEGFPSVNLQFGLSFNF